MRVPAADRLQRWWRTLLAREDSLMTGPQLGYHVVECGDVNRRVANCDEQTRRATINMLLSPALSQL